MTVTEYLAKAPQPHRAALERLHKAILAAVPDAEQRIRQSVPQYRHRQRPLVSIAHARQHVALYLMYGDVLKAYAPALRDHDVAKTVVRFAPEKPIPATLVTEMVAARRAEIDAAATGR